MEDFPGALHVMTDPTGLDAEQHAVSGQILGRAGPVDGTSNPSCWTPATLTGKPFRTIDKQVLALRPPSHILR